MVLDDILLIEEGLRTTGDRESATGPRLIVHRRSGRAGPEVYRDNAARAVLDRLIHGPDFVRLNMDQWIRRSAIRGIRDGILPGTAILDLDGHAQHLLVMPMREDQTLDERIAELKSDIDGAPA